VPKRQVNNASRDKADNKYIECAIESNVDYIISGDMHLLELKEYKYVKIVTAKSYLENREQRTK
jgi:predicted nucleic acid-binding protein